MASIYLIIPLLVSFLITFFLLPAWIKKARKFNFQGQDMNKYGNVKVPEGGGLIALAGFILGILTYIAINQFIFNLNDKLIEIFAITTSLLILGMIGLIDGALGWKVGLRRRVRIWLCLFAAVPLMVINAGQSTFAIPLLGEIHSGLLYPLFLIPIGIIATSTTFNFLAGFNGQEAGQGAILLTALSIIAYVTGHTWLAFICWIVIVSLLAFLFFNFCPAKVFPGDVLTYPIGGLVAITAILGNFERIAIFFFIPYIIETGLKLRGKLVKQSFGAPQKDGTLDLKYKGIYSLNHLSIYLMKKLNIKPTEEKVVFSIWLFQVVIILMGFIIFWKGIFAQ